MRVEPGRGKDSACGFVGAAQTPGISGLAEQVSRSRALKAEVYVNVWQHLAFGLRFVCILPKLN